MVKMALPWCYFAMLQKSTIDGCRCCRVEVFELVLPVTLGVLVSNYDAGVLEAAVTCS
jgi:hypothetical protein